MIDGGEGKRRDLAGCLAGGLLCTHLDCGIGEALGGRRVLDPERNGALGLGALARVNRDVVVHFLTRGGGPSGLWQVDSHTRLRGSGHAAAIPQRALGEHAQLACGRTGREAEARWEGICGAGQARDAPNSKHPSTLALELSASVRAATSTAYRRLYEPTPPTWIVRSPAGASEPLWI